MYISPDLWEWSPAILKLLYIFVKSKNFGRRVNVVIEKFRHNFVVTRFLTKRSVLKLTNLLKFFFFEYHIFVKRVLIGSDISFIK